jgi:hypothetical protein
MAESSNVVGEGTYGCVHSPPLNCEKNQQRPAGNKITKLMKDDEANTELKEYGTMESVDPDQKYYLGTPSSCKVDINSYNKTSASKCKRLIKTDPQIVNNLSKYTLLIMENGGDNLETFSNKILRWSIKENRSHKINRFWLEAHRTLMGVKTFLDNGVLHHDLKPQNIVYNEETGRINFIDFGLMQNKNMIITEAIKSKYGFSNYHWSFPMECKFLNLKSYDKYADKSDKFKNDHLKSIAGSLKEGGGTEASDAIRFFLYYTTNKEGNILNNEKVAKQILKQFGETLLHVVTPGVVPYEIMVNKCLDTFDLYGLGLGLLNVLRNAYQIMDIKLVVDLEKLFLDMTCANVMKRIDINTAITRYEDIMDKRNILKQFNKHFKNHELIDGPLIPIVLEKKIEEASAKAEPVSDKEVNKLLAENPEALEPQHAEQLMPKKKKLIIRVVEKTPNSQNLQSEKRSAGLESKGITCPEGKEMNPKTRRCVKKCKEGESRNDKFECRRTQRKWKKRKNEK